MPLHGKGRKSSIQSLSSQAWNTIVGLHQYDKSGAQSAVRRLVFLIAFIILRHTLPLLLLLESARSFISLSSNTPLSSVNWLQSTNVFSWNVECPFDISRTFHWLEQSKNFRMFQWALRAQRV